MTNIRIYSENVQFLVLKFSIYLNSRAFVVPKAHFASWAASYYFIHHENMPI